MWTDGRRSSKFAPADTAAAFPHRMPDMTAPSAYDARFHGPLADRIPSLAGPRAAFRIGPGRRLEFDPDPRIDERLVLLRLLEYLHCKFPIDFEEGEAAAEALAALRSAFAGGASAPGATPKLGELFLESASLCDRLAGWLAAAGVQTVLADRARFVQAPSDLPAELVLGGGRAYVGAEAVAATTESVGALLQEAAVELLGAELPQSEASALRRAWNGWLEDRARLLQQAAALADDLRAERGWVEGEAGFDPDDDPAESILDADDAEDRGYFRRRMKRLRQRRARDPFVHLSSGALWVEWAEQAHAAGDDENATPQLIGALDDFLQAVRRLPLDAYFDPLRSDCLLAAACAAEALAYHARRRDDLALVLADAALRFRPHDPRGRIAHVRSLALARCGRCVEAVSLRKKAAAAQDAEAGMHYDLASLYSMAGRPDEALSHLQAAWNLGRRDVRWMRRDRDLETLRCERPAEFERLVTPTWTFETASSGGGFTAAARNHSAFALHNVALRAAWKGAEGVESYEVYWTSDLAAGAGRRFTGLFGGAPLPEELRSSLQVAMLCDETRDVHPPGIAEVVGLWSGVSTRMPAAGDAKVKSSGPMRLIVEKKGGARLTLEFSDADADLRLTADGLRDGRARAASPGGVQRASLFFHGNFAYGWRQSGEEAAADDLRAFWLQRGAGA